jgi:hemerythrin-like domain-containing protein
MHWRQGLNSILSGLVEDHAVIHDAFLVLRRFLQSLETENQLSVETILDLLDDFQVFIEDLHFAKEESLLFPWLTDRGVKDRAGPLSSMMVQHIQVRGLLHNLIDSLAEGKEKTAVVSQAEKFMTCLSDHIRDEEETLFPLADGLMGDTDGDDLAASFEQFSLDLANSSSLARFSRRVEEMKSS